MFHLFCEICWLFCFKRQECQMSKDMETNNLKQF